MCVSLRLELSVTREPGERDHVANIFNARYVHDKSLETDAEALVGNGAKLPQVSVETVVGG